MVTGPRLSPAGTAGLSPGNLVHGRCGALCFSVKTQQLWGRASKVIWLMGLSGAGKTPIASALEQRLHAPGKQVYVRADEVLRQVLNADVGFSNVDGAWNPRRTAQVAWLMVGARILMRLMHQRRADRRQSCRRRHRLARLRTRFRE